MRPLWLLSVLFLIPAAPSDAADPVWSYAFPDLFQDTFARDVDLHSANKENAELTGGDPWESADSLTISVVDTDTIVTGGVKIHWRGSIDCGQTFTPDPARVFGWNGPVTQAWNSKALVAGAGDTYRTRLTTFENPTLLDTLGLWDEGTIVEYFFTVEDAQGVVDTFPDRLSDSRTNLGLVNAVAGYDRRLPWPFHTRVLPCPQTDQPLPPGQNRAVLLVTGDHDRVYDIEAGWRVAFDSILAYPRISQVVKESINRLGIVYDEYVDRGAGTGLASQPFHNAGFRGVRSSVPDSLRYDAVIWFHGDEEKHTIQSESQTELATCLAIPANEGHLELYALLFGDDLCEDSALAGTTFWTDQLGLGGAACTADSGIDTTSWVADPEPAELLDGIAKSIVLPIAGREGAIDSLPVLRHVDSATGGTARVLARYETKPVVFQQGRITTAFLSLELLANQQIRDCWMSAYLDSNGVGVSNPMLDCDESVGVMEGAETVPGVSFARVAASPNPFNPTISLAIDLRAAGDVTVTIHDASGRERRKLWSGPMEPGAHALRWDGRDDAGRAAGSGVYLYRVRQGSSQIVGKITLLR